MHRWIIRAAVVASIASVSPQDADACGGLFCAGGGVIFPVAQTGEGIVFAVDRQKETVQAIISIEYQGTASEFAWVLPLQSAPLELDVAPAQTFNIIDLFTQPSFSLSFESEGICSEVGDFTFAPGANASEDAAGSVERDAGGVRVLGQEEVGPYDSVVIQSSDPDDLREWLVANEYFVDDAMMESVTPYVANGDALLALKLRKTSDVGDIQPVVVTMAGNEVCVPIRLTAIAALEDMTITTLVLSNEGRAIPENYNHVTLNLAKINWLQGASNYEQLVAQAADEGSGNAFTTEFAGEASVFRGVFWTPQYDRSSIESTTTVSQFVLALQLQNLLVHREIIGILARHLPDSTFEAIGTTKEAFQRDPGSVAFVFPPDPFDPAAATQEIWDRIIDPLQRVQETFDGYRYATRLFTLISPHEMMIDPTFVFDPKLPNVSSLHRANAVRQCGVGGDPGDGSVRIEILETGQTIEMGDGSVDRSLLDRMPSALKIEQLNEGRLIQDNSAAIADLLNQHNARVGGCGCSTTEETGGAWVGLMLLGLVLVMRKRR